MATYPPQAVTLEAGWEEEQAHGPAPWLDVADEDAAYLEGTAFLVFWVDFGTVEAFDSFWLDVQARPDGFPVLRVSKTYEATGSDTPGVSVDVAAYRDDWPDEQWSRGLLSVPLSHEGGPLTLWFRTTSAGGLWALWLSYMALVTEAVIVPPIRRVFPRPDGRAGGAPRTFPPSPTIQSGNRTSGAIF